MARVLWLLLCAVVGVAATLALAALPGRVSADIGEFNIVLPTSLAVAALLLLAAMLHSLIALLRWPYRIGARNSARRRRNGDAATTGALVALAASDAGAARRQAGRARRLLGDTPQTLLLVAEAGRLAGREDEASVAFRALATQRDAAFLGLRGLLRQAITREDWAGATELARRAETTYPGAAWLREERGRLAIRGADWPEALRLATDPVARSALATAVARTEPNAERALEIARNAWESDAGLAPAALAFADRLRRLGREGRAQTVIADSWAIRPHPDLAAFALAASVTALDAVKLGKTLAASNPDHPESHFLLARASLAAGLTGEARRQVQKARDGGMNERRLFLLLAAVEAAEDHGPAAAEATRQATLSDPDTIWRCNACNVGSAEWHPACPACHTPGGLRWGDNGETATYSRPGIIRRFLPWR